MQVLRYVLFVSVLQFALTSTAMAALISVDLHTRADGLLTRDTDTGLEWLDLTASLNYSYYDVLTEFSAGGAFEGFRYATVSDVDNLQLSAGLPSGRFLSGSSIYRTRVSDLMDLVGITQTSGNYEYSYGLTGNPFEPTTFIDDRRMRGFSLNLGVSAVHGIVGDKVASPTIGSWLIRDAVYLPEPASLALLLFGLLGLGVNKYRIKRGIN